MIDKWGLKYQYAHQIALRAEMAAVEASGLEWKEENAFMMKWIKSADSEQITDVPEDLDMLPYVDENDKKLIKVMKKAMVK